MHELAVTQGIVDFALKEGTERKVRQITALNIKLGAFSGIVSLCVQDYFDLLAEGTLAEGAKLNFETIPGELYCPDCDKHFPMEHFRLVCPGCKGRNVKMTKGREFYIDTMEVEMED